MISVKLVMAEPSGVKHKKRAAVTMYGLVNPSLYSASQKIMSEVYTKKTQQ